MNWKTWGPLVLALGLGLVAAKVARDMIVRSRVANTAPKTASIVVAKQAVAPGQALRLEDLALTQIATEAAPQGSFTRPEDLIGRVVLTSLVPEQAVFETLLAPVGSAAGLQALIPDGMRAISIEVNEFSGVAGLLMPGCRVDVITTFRDEESGETVSRSIVQNVKVTAVGRAMSASVQSGDNKSGEQNNEMSRSVTLLATPEEAEAIELATSVGRPRLVLRGNNDDVAEARDGVTLAVLRGRSARKVDPFHVRPIELFPPSSQPSDQRRNRADASDASRNVTVIRSGVESSVVFQLNDEMNGAVTGVSHELRPN